MACAQNMLQLVLMTGHLMMQVVFAWAKDAGGQQQIDETVSGAEVRLFSSELDMLKAWLAFFMEADPDSLILFQVCK